MGRRREERSERQATEPGQVLKTGCRFDGLRTMGLEQ